MSTSALTPTEDGDLKEQDPSLSEDKVVVLFKPTGGDTPLLKQTKVKVLRSAKFVDVVSHLSRQVKRAHVFVY